MSRQRQSNKHIYVVLISVLCVVSFLGSGLAANIDSGSGNAGQGVTVSAGYTSSVIKYSGSWAGGGNNTNTNVTGFNFVLKKTTDGGGTSTVTNDNTVVYAQLVTATTNGNWAQCYVGTTPVAGTVVCSLTGSQQKPMSQVTGVNIIAHDADIGPGAAGVPVNPYTTLMNSATVSGASSDTTLLEGGDLYRVVTWTSTTGEKSITPNQYINVEYLVVGGGGGGGADVGGGGGGGQVRTGTATLPITTNSVSVGAGGIGAPIISANSGLGGSGGSSVAFSVSAAGGSGGGGGSGGYFGGASGSGNSGATFFETSPHFGGGGGGGNSGVGFATSPNGGGGGGAGLLSFITGAGVVYGGGGGSGYLNTSSTTIASRGLGASGAGDGAVTSNTTNLATASAGVDGRGGGGGGGGWQAASPRNDAGAAGGSGVVIARWKLSTDMVRDGLILNLDATNPYSYPGSGTTWTDLTGNGYNGTLVNGPTYSSVNGGVIVLDGVNDYIDVPINLTNQNYTIMGAARYVTVGGRTFSGKNNNWLMGHWRGTTRNYYATSWVSGVGNGESDTNWRLYAATGNYAADSWALYVNGALNAGPNTGGANGPNGFSIGSYLGASEFSNSHISNLIVYNRVLTDAEIQQNFEALRGRYGI